MMRKGEKPSSGKFIFAYLEIYIFLYRFIYNIYLHIPKLNIKRPGAMIWEWAREGRQIRMVKKGKKKEESVATIF